MQPQAGHTDRFEALKAKLSTPEHIAAVEAHYAAQAEAAAARVAEQRARVRRLLPGLTGERLENLSIQLANANGEWGPVFDYALVNAEYGLKADAVAFSLALNAEASKAEAA